MRRRGGGCEPNTDAHRPAGVERLSATRRPDPRRRLAVAVVAGAGGPRGAKRVGAFASHAGCEAGTNVPECGDDWSEQFREAAGEGRGKGTEVVSYARLSTTAPETSALMPKAARSSAPGGGGIGDPNDAYEQEADRVADEVMSGGAARRHWSLSTMRTGAPLQRKCSCGGSAGSTGVCEQCQQKQEEPTVQRKAAGTAGPAFAPP